MSTTLNALKVPSVDINSIRALLHLDTDAFDSVIELLCGEFQPKIDVLKNQIASIPGVDSSDAQAWIGMFRRWCSARRAMFTSSEVFITQYSLGLGLLKNDEWDTETARRWDVVKGRFGKVIEGNSAIAVYAKGMDLLFDHQECMRTSRIVTDVRPIYDDEAAAICGSVVYHTLSIDYIANGDELTHHIVMDSSDLVRLKNQIERAIRKEALITNRLYTSEIPVLDMHSEEGMT